MSYSLICFNNVLLWLKRNGRGRARTIAQSLIFYRHISVCSQL